MHIHPPYAELINQKTIITGEVNTGKTTLTGQLAESVCAQEKQQPMLVLDMAPTIPETLQPKTGKGRISGNVTFAGMHEALIFKEALVPPRLMGTSDAHIRELAGRNRDHIDTWLEQARTRSPFDLVIINDLSIYLQAGTARTLEVFLATAKTVIANGYVGQTLGKGELSGHEREEMERLCRFFDQRIHLEKIQL